MLIFYLDNYMIDKCYQPIHYFEGFGEVVHYFEIYVFTHCFLYIICRDKKNSDYDMSSNTYHVREN